MYLDFLENLHVSDLDGIAGRSELIYILQPFSDAHAQKFDVKIWDPDLLMFTHSLVPI